MTLKQGPGHRTWCEHAEPNQVLSRLTFVIPCLYSVCEKKANFKVTLKSENMSIIFLEHVQKWEVVVYSFCTWFTNPTAFQLDRTRTYDFCSNWSTLFWLWNIVKVTESGMNRSISMSSTIMQTLTFITSMVSEEISMLKFPTSQDTWPTKNILISSLEYTPESQNSYCTWSC